MRPTNLFLTTTGVVKLGCFGFPSPLNDSSENEGDQSLIAMTKRDVWSLGKTLIELAESNTRWKGEQGGVANRASSRMNLEFSSLFTDFTSKCLVKDVKMRASVSELMGVRNSDKS